METDGEGGGGGEAGMTGCSELGRLLETIESSDGGLEVAVGEGWEEAAQEECVLNTTDNAFPTLETMAMEVEPAQAVGMQRDAMAMCSLAPVMSPPPQEALHRCTHCASEKASKWLERPDGPGTLCNACWQKGQLLHSNLRRRRGRPSIKGRRCTHCGSEKTSRWLRGPDGPATLCNACGKRFLRGRLIPVDSNKPRQLLHSNPCHCRGSRLSRMENSAGSNDVAALVEGLPCGLDASLDAFFDQMGSEVSWEEAGPGWAEEEELEWLSNKDAFPSVETMALEVEVEKAWAVETPRARTKGRRRVTAMETTSPQANVPRPCAEKETTVMPPVLPQRWHGRCTHCATESTPEWRQGPDGPRTLCNACGIVFMKKGRLLAEYRPANSPAFSPLLHANTYARALRMHLQNETSAIGEMHVKLMDPPPPVKGSTSSVRPRLLPRRRPCSGDRRCTGCATEKTPQWREGPEGPRTLCNACGVVFKTKGRLLPEYRPAKSPVFSPLLHSNSYTRALEMHCQNETTSVTVRCTRKASCSHRRSAQLPPPRCLSASS